MCYTFLTIERGVLIYAVLDYVACLCKILMYFVLFAALQNIIYNLYLYPFVSFVHLYVKCSMLYWFVILIVFKIITHIHTLLTALCPGLPGSAGTRKVKPIWILLKQETVSGSEIRWAICKSAPRSRQITTPAHHHSVFYRPDALPAAQPTVSKH